MSKPAAKRYAKALFSITEENKTTDAVFKDMQLVVSTLSANKSLKSVMLSPVIEESKKLEIVKAIFKSSSEQTLQLMKVLSTNGRIKLLGLVAQAFVEMVEIANHIQRAEVTTAVALDAKLEKEVQSKIKALTGNEADLTVHVDPELLGGFVLKINDLQFDASVATQLDKVKRELVN